MQKLSQAGFASRILGLNFYSGEYLVIGCLGYVFNISITYRLVDTNLLVRVAFLLFLPRIGYL